MINGLQISDINVEKLLDSLQVQVKHLPTASRAHVGKLKQYIGATNDTYTHGFFYECLKTESYTITSEITGATCSSENLLALLMQITPDFVKVVGGSMEYDASGATWNITLLDKHLETIATYRLYTVDLEEIGFVFPETLEDGDIVSFSCEIVKNTTYAWTNVLVQPMTR